MRNIRETVLDQKLVELGGNLGLAMLRINNLLYDLQKSGQITLVSQPEMLLTEEFNEDYIQSINIGDEEISVVQSRNTTVVSFKVNIYADDLSIKLIRK